MATVATTPSAQIETLPKRPNAAWAFVKSQPLGLLGFLIILVYVVCAFGARWIAPFDPEAIDFVAMLSPHIDRGRRNLAAATVRLMRRVGMSAFQTTLLPLATPDEVKRLNQLPVDTLAGEKVDVAAEVERALAVVTPVGRWGRLDVHLAGDLFDVFVNLRGWNEELRTADGRTAWGKRSCAYFVFDPATGQFAPSKFCAYTPISLAGDSTGVTSDSHRMTVSAYTALNDGTHIMDGNRAWQHLVRCLGMRTVTGDDTGSITSHFVAWLADHGETITVRGGSPTFVLPPAWYLA